MEKRSKVRNKDKISQLPDDFLFKILSLIPIRDAMSTCLLSKRWKLVWKMMPTLDFHETSYRKINSLSFQEFYRISLHSHEAPVLSSLNLKLIYCHDVECQFLLILRQIILEITISSSSYAYIRFPRYLSTFKTLVVMRLQGRLTLEVYYPPVCFQSLKSLHLSRVTYRGVECLTALLSACPVLEDLFMETNNDGVSLFNISVPSLRRLSIMVYRNYESRSFVINTPCLIYLKIEDQESCFNFVVGIPNLVEAHVKVNHFETEKLLRLFSSVQRLSIHFFSSKRLHIAGTIFKRLLHLELHMDEKLHRTTVQSFLKRSLNLQALILNGKLLGSINNQLRLVRKPRSVPECLTFHLETLESRGYAGRQDDKEIVDYIFRNAPCLKMAKISRCVSSSKKKDLRIVKELKSISKVLTSCQLVIQPQKSP